MDKPALIKRNTERRAQGWKTAEISLDDFDALIAENERLRDSYQQVCENYNKVSYASEERGKQIDQLKAENEALRKDAERLRWLRQYEFDIGSYYGVYEHNAAAWFEHISDEDIDSMIADEAQFAKESGHD